MRYNVYCDETCHLEHDGINVMAIGAVWCPQNKLLKINQRISQIKNRHDVPNKMELKWTKISPGKFELYLDLVNYFFDDDDLHFRVIVIPDKSKLDHVKFHQTHDTWYYKMYFDMLKMIFIPTESYEVYIDIKDTNTHDRAQKLKDVCNNSMYDFSGRIIRRIQPIKSEEIQIMQLVDILVGATGYENRIFPKDFIKSQAKQNIINLIKKRSGYTITKTTLQREEKFNILVWNAKLNDE